jgi:WD40 repeat protein
VSEVRFPRERDQWLPTYTGGVRAFTHWRSGEGNVLLASGGTDGTIRLWDSGTGISVGRPFKPHAGTVSTLTSWQAPGGVRLVSGGTDALVCVCDPATGTVESQFTTDGLSSAMSVACWRDREGRSRIAIGTYDATIYLWDPDADELVAKFRTGHTGAIICLAFWRDPDGADRIASGSDDGTVRVWDPETHDLLGDPFVAHAAVEDLYCWSLPNGQVRIASASEDGAVYVWDPATGIPVGTPFSVDTTGVWALSGWQQPGQGAYLVAASGAGAIRIWNADTGETSAAEIAGPRGPARTLVIWQTADSAMRLAACGTDGKIGIWDLGTGQAVHEIAADHVGTVYALAACHAAGDDVRLISIGSDSILRIYDPRSGISQREFETGHITGVWAVNTWTAPGDGIRILTGGLDGALRVWDLNTGDAVSQLVPAHTAAVAALASWRGTDGVLYAASCGDDALIRLWNLETNSPIGAPLAGHGAGVLALARWENADGSSTLASDGGDGTIRFWDPYTGLEVREPLAGPSAGVWSLAFWRAADGGARLAAGAYDGSVRIWNPDTGQLVGTPLLGGAGAVRAIAVWPRPDGGVHLAATSGNVVRVWDAETGAAYAQTLLGHTAAVRTLAVWQEAGGAMRLASAGDDGTVRLWDPERGVSLRTIEVGSVRLWGLSDVPAEVDLLGREALITALADQLCPPLSDAPDVDTGPTVVTIEGPWGCGKSTTMKLIEKQLRATYGSSANPHGRSPLTVREAMRSLHSATDDGRRVPPEQAAAAKERRGVATAWFNPWVHESGEQIWAGLLQSIIDAVGPTLYSTESDRDRYWFAHNLPRLNRHAVRRALQRRIVSPLLGVALVVVVVPAALALAQLGKSFLLLGRSITTLDIALLLPAAFVIAGIVHTFSRYARGAAVDYLPSEIFNGPVGGAVHPDSAILGDSQSSIVDPLRAARAGSLYLHQHDLIELLADTAASGHDLIIFVDDLDRCRASTTTEVFEAINLFLAGVGSQAGLRAHFVIGLDPVVIAAHLDRYYTSTADSHSFIHGDDPSAGWAFLRKLVQLPVIIPRVSDTGLDHFIDTVVGTRPHDEASSTPQPTSRIAESRSPQRASSPAHSMGAQSEDGSFQLTSHPRLAEGKLPIRQEVIAQHALEQHPKMRQLMRDRLGAQPNRSIREAKRLLNVWQLYERVLARVEPLEDPTQAIARASSVMILAEIVTRWPALQHHLHRHADGSVNALQLLAAAADNDRQWRAVVDRLQVDRASQARALTGLRDLLIGHESAEISRLAGVLF